MRVWNCHTGQVSSIFTVNLWAVYFLFVEVLLHGLFVKYFVCVMQCGEVVNFSDECGSLLCEGPCMFVGLPNAVKVTLLSLCINVPHMMHEVGPYLPG